MADMNKFLFTGNLVGDPTQVTSGNGKPFTRFSVASNKYSGASKQIEAIFVSCVAFGTTGEFVLKNAKKGSKAFVCGALSLDKYKGRDGVEKYGLSVTADDVQLLTFGKQEKEEAQATSDTPAVAQPDPFSSASENSDPVLAETPAEKDPFGN